MKLQVVVYKLSVLFMVIGIVTLTGCASVPMASEEKDTLSKTFAEPTSDKAGLYVFRNSLKGQTVLKAVFLDGIEIGETTNKVYFHMKIIPGSHKLSTKSGFSDDTVTFQAEGGKNYFARHYIKLGILAGAAGIEMVNEEKGKKQVLQCKQAELFDNICVTCIRKPNRPSY